MKLVVKTKTIDLCFVKTDKNQIIGWFNGNWVRYIGQLSDTISVESHFTYSKDGNFHFTHILKDNENSIEYFINVYFDKVKIKTIDKKNSPVRLHPYLYFLAETKYRKTPKIASIDTFSGLFYL